MVASAYLKMLYPRRELESPDSIAGKTAIETDYAKTWFGHFLDEIIRIWNSNFETKSLIKIFSAINSCRGRTDERTKLLKTQYGKLKIMDYLQRDPTGWLSISNFPLLKCLLRHWSTLGIKTSLLKVVNCNY